MALPENFNRWEHFQDVGIKVFNKEVRDWFKDVTDDDNITTPRASLKEACLIDDNDTAPIMACKMMFFYVTLRKCQDFMPTIVGSRLDALQESRKHRPEVSLYFLEDQIDVDPEFTPVTGQVSFRLMDYTSESISQGKVNSLALAIKNEFATPSYIWKKGKYLVSYKDVSSGWDFKVLCRSLNEGKEVITKTMNLNNDSPNWSKANFNENQEISEAYPTLPSNQNILGKSRREPRKRPIADVRFRYATLTLWGLPHPIILTDTTGQYRNAIESIFNW